MGLFSRKKNFREIAFVFDIGSSSIGGAVFQVNKLGSPKIIFSIREPIILERNIDSERFLFLTLKSLEVVASKICRKGFGKPSEIFCVLSSPWYLSQTRTIKYQKNTSFTFSQKLADDLIQKELAILKEEKVSNFSNAKNNKIRLIESKNMKVSLNGYISNEPFNKKTQKLEMTVFMSASESQLLEKIENVIFRHFHTEKIKFCSFVMASFAVARDIFADQEDFLLVDIGGETTDISMIKKNILGHSISYPLGRNFIVRKVSENLNCSLDEAKSLVALYNDGHASEYTEKELESTIKNLKNEWLKGFQESLVNLSNDISIPAMIFITVDQDLADFFSKTIKAEEFNQYTLTESEFRVVFLGVETFHKVINFENNVIRDPFLIIETIYINRFIF